MSINSLLSSLQSSYSSTKSTGLLSSDRTQSYAANSSLAALIAKRSKYIKKAAPGSDDAGTDANSIDASLLSSAAVDASQQSTGSTQTSASTATSSPSTASQDPKALAAEKLAQNKSLEDSLTDVLDYVSDKHGTAAAQAMRGIILNKLGDQDVTEESLGKAMLAGVSFIDHQFGIAQGDKFMAKINNSLNGAMNDYFDNGEQEVFLDASKMDMNFLSDRVSIAADKVSEDIADAVSDMASDGTDSKKLKRKKKQARSLYDQQGYDQQGQTVQSDSYATGQAVNVAA